MIRIATPRQAIRSILIAQVVLAVGLVAMDVYGTPGNAAPGMFAPPADGPSVRPYRPGLRPGTPGGPATRPMSDRLEFAVEEGVISVSGQIAPGDADRFAAWLGQTRPAEAVVALNSSGGSVSDALAIGRTIRTAGYETKVGSAAVCLSACPYMLSGGVERRAEMGAVVGVHQHYFGESRILPAFLAVKDVQLGQASVMDFLAEMGVDLRLMSYALRTPPEDINVLSPDLMRELRLTTETG